MLHFCHFFARLHGCEQCTAQQHIQSPQLLRELTALVTVLTVARLAWTPDAPGGALPCWSTGSPSSALSLTSLDPFVPHRVLSHNPPDIDIAHPRLHITLPVSVLQTPCLLLCFHSPTLFHLQPGEVFNLFIYFSLLVQHLWTSCSLGNPANSSALWCTRRPASPVCHLFLLLFFSFPPQYVLIQP